MHIEYKNLKLCENFYERITKQHHVKHVESYQLWSNRNYPPIQCLLKTKINRHDISHYQKQMKQDYSISHRKAVENCLHTCSWHTYLEHVDRRECICHEEDLLGKVQIQIILCCKRPKVSSQFSLKIKYKSIYFHLGFILLKILI